MSSLQGGRAGTPVSRTCNRPWHLALIYFHINFSFIYSSHPSVQPFGQPSFLPLSIKPTRTASLHPSPPLFWPLCGEVGGPGPCLRVPGASPRLPTSLPFAVTERHRLGVRSKRTFVLTPPEAGSPRPRRQPGRFLPRPLSARSRPSSARGPTWSSPGVSVPISSEGDTSRTGLGPGLITSVKTLHPNAVAF